MTLFHHCLRIHCDCLWKYCPITIWPLYSYDVLRYHRLTDMVVRFWLFSTPCFDLPCSKRLINSFTDGECLSWHWKKKTKTLLVLFSFFAHSQDRKKISSSPMVRKLTSSHVGRWLKRDQPRLSAIPIALALGVQDWHVSTKSSKYLLFYNQRPTFRSSFPHSIKFAS